MPQIDIFPHPFPGSEGIRSRLFSAVAASEGPPLNSNRRAAYLTPMRFTSTTTAEDAVVDEQQPQSESAGEPAAVEAKEESEQRNQWYEVMKNKACTYGYCVLFRYSPPPS